MTVIAGGSRCNGRYFGWHLQRTDRGQTVAVRDVVGLMGENMHEWFDQMEAMAAGGNTTNFFYHFSLSPREDEPFTDEQREVAVATALKNLGLENQPYFLVEHGGKDGRSPHYHCIVLRVDLDTGKAISDSHNYDIHMRTADELEKLFGHEHTERGRGPDGPNPKGYEVQRGQETGIDPKDVKAEITALWHQCDNAQALVAAIADRGYILAEGDRGLCIVDSAGDEHSLARRAGVRLKDVDARMEAIDREALPTVAEARALARERAAERDASARDASPLPADPAAKRDDPAAFDLVAETLIDAVRVAVAEKEPDIPKAEPTAFDALAQDIVREAKEATPVVAEVAAVAASAEPELSAFERFAQGSKAALRAVDEGLLIAEGLAWLAKKLGPPSVDPPVADHEPTAFARFAQETKQAMRENGGEPAPGFWERSINLLAAARDRAVEWAKGSAQHFVGLITRNRNRDHESGIER